MPHQEMKMNREKDPHSYAEPDKVMVSHLNLDLCPNFENHQISGIAELTLEWQDKNANRLLLDTKKLAIQKFEAINSDGTWNQVQFNLGTEDAFLGSALQVELKEQNKKVRIFYTTHPEANGLQWLNKNQTASKKFPYLYSQSEPILARSWIPIQDTPSVRFTYSAQITIPKELRAVMSAENDPDHPLNGQFEFNMPQKIPAYLIAFAVGNISVQKIGPRSAVYSEPTIVIPAAKEFADTEQMIQTTEKLYGSYQWGTYDILVLPPAFPFGGMENPRLTFATPTVIVGDKSLISLVAHELAHSWSGNLVTNSAWSHIWLNEGFTSYVQNRIVEEVYGKEQAHQEFIIWTNGLPELFKKLSAADQHLVLNLQGRDPDDGMSDVAYIKGAWFLKTLEEYFGRNVFDGFLREYFTHFAFQSISSDQFKDFLKINLIDRYPSVYTIEQVDKWMHQPGIPKDAVFVHSNRLAMNDNIRSQWLNGEISASKLKANEWSCNEWQYFLDRIPDAKLTYEQAKELDDVYHLTVMDNRVIATKWYKIAIHSEYTEANSAIREHLSVIGRRILVLPLYQALLQTEVGKKLAQDIYKQARPTYHSVTRDSIDKEFNAVSLEILPPDSPMRLNGLQQFSQFRKVQKIPDCADHEVRVVEFKC